uniref:Uncharacterized protein n=1 Tax=Manihot esculenta TaxID=3983 RepID=A0A2C9W3Z4_MANES
MATGEDDATLLIDDEASGGARGRKFGVEGTTGSNTQHHYGGNYLVSLSPTIGGIHLLLKRNVVLPAQILRLVEVVVTRLQTHRLHLRFQFLH